MARAIDSSFKCLVYKAFSEEVPCELRPFFGNWPSASFTKLVPVSLVMIRFTPK
jgi:hypothetical protein